MNKTIALSAAVLTAAVAMPGQAAVIWDFNFTDAGVGFDDPTAGTGGQTVGENRQAVLESAGDYLSSFLTDYTATIFMDVDGTGSTPGNLAAAGSNYNTVPPRPGSWSAATSC